MKTKKILSIVLSVTMLAGTAVAVRAENGNNIIYSEDFNGDTALDSSWNANGGVVENDVLKIKQGGWPQLNFAGTADSKIYEFSYRMKFDMAGGTMMNYNRGMDIGFGTAVPGTGIGNFKKYTSIDDLADITGLNVWYTVKAEFCTDAVHRYIKYTILDENGQELYAEKDNKIYKNGTACGMFDSISLNNLCFWNKNNTGNVYIDDVVLKEIGEIPESNVIFEEHFTDNKFDLSLWEQQGAVFENDSMAIPQGKYPYLYIPDVSDKNSAYRLSYKIKGVTNGNNVKIYGDRSSNRGFGGYDSNLGFSFKALNVKDYSVEYSTADYNNEQYTVEVDFCEKEGLQYTRWTLKNEYGDVLYRTKVNGLWNSEKGETVTDSIFGKRICFWNSGSNESTVYIDDVKLENIGSSINFEEDFEVSDIEALYADGNGWRRNVNGSIEDGKLKLPCGAYIYFDIDKSKDAPYKISYDIMTTGETETTDGTALIVNDKYLLGAYNPLVGLDTYKHTFDDVNTIPVSQANGKWYTVTAEINETKANGYMKYTLTDKAENKEVGSYTLPMLKDEKDNAIEENAGAFYFWNRGGAENVTYIDNLKLEEIEQKMYMTSVTALDLAENSLEITDNITPLIGKINIQLTSSVAEVNGISLKAADGTDVDITAVPIGKNIVITLNEALKSNTDYTFAVTNELNSEMDIALENPITVNFTTNARETIGRIKSIGAENIDGLTSGGTVEVKAAVANSDKESKTAAVIAAFYSGDILEDVRIKNDITVGAGEIADDITFEVDVPADISKLTSMKVFLWDSISGLVPYADYAELTK